MKLVAGYEFPAGWKKGELLDLKRYTNGTFDAFLMGADEKEARKRGEYLSFENSDQAQAFVSEWYAREALG